MKETLQSFPKCRQIKIVKKSFDGAKSQHPNSKQSLASLIFFIKLYLYAIYIILINLSLRFLSSSAIDQNKIIILIIKMGKPLILYTSFTLIIVIIAASTQIQLNSYHKPTSKRILQSYSFISAKDNDSQQKGHKNQYCPQGVNQNPFVPYACCPPGSWPALSFTYTPQGKIIDIDGLRVYKIGKGKKVLIMFEDIFGIDSGRHKAVADTYAKLGFKVYMPQLLQPVFNGSITEVPKIYQVIQQQIIDKIYSKYDKLRKHLKEEGVEKVFAAGFCWGAWAAFRLSKQFGGIIAIAAIHPSLNVQLFYGGTQVKLVQSAKCPAYFYAASNDQPATKPGGQYINIISQKFGADKTGSQLFPDQTHGFMMRADGSDPNAVRDTQRIITSSLEYFSKFL